ncbi:MAG: flagellin [Alphaproteobacteria bacterium]
MSTRISLTESMRSNLLSLQQTNDLFDITQERLATGKKVNSALDNPDNYFTAASLNNRANDLESLMDSMGQGVQTLKAADQGIEALTDLAEQAKSLTTTALDSSIVDSTISGTLKIDGYDDIKEITGIEAGDTFVISSKEDSAEVKSVMNRAVTENTLLSSLSEDLTTDLNAYQFEIYTKDGDNGDKMATIKLDVDPATATVGDFMSAINSNETIDVTASIDEDGNLVLKSNDNSLITVRDSNYAGEVTGLADLSPTSGGSTVLSDITGGSIANGTAYTFFIRNGERSDQIAKTIQDATADTTFNSLDGVTTLNAGSGATINYMLGGVSASIEIVANSSATTATGITLDNIASAFNSIAGITASVTESAGDVYLSITTDSGESIVITGGTNNGGNIVSGLGLMSDTYTATISGAMTVGDLVSTISDTAHNITASITTNGKLSISQSGTDIKNDLAIVGSGAASKTALTDLLGTNADATAGVNVANNTSTLAATLGYDTYNFEITIPQEVTTAEDLVDSINAAATAANLDITASIVDKKLVITDNLGNDLSIFDVNGGESALVLGVETNDTTGANARAEYAEQFDLLRQQMSELIEDTGYKGVNLLNGDDLTVIFNANRTSKLEIKGVTLDAVGLGISETENKWKTNEDIQKQLEQVERALETLRSQASVFGNNLTVVQTREDFSEGLIDTLTAGADKLTIADMNEEAANMLALQTRQELGTNSLSLASQSAQSVLKLF